MELIRRLAHELRVLFRDLRGVDKKRLVGAGIILSLLSEPLVDLPALARVLFSVSVLLTAAAVLWKPLLEVRRARRELERRDAAEVAQIRNEALRALREGDAP